MESKSIEQWEIAKGLLVHAEKDPSRIVTEAEFDKIPLVEKTGVNFADRITFLQNNGYEVTRENMINRDLSAKVNPEE